MRYLSRRQFLASTAAAGMLGAGPSLLLSGRPALAMPTTTIRAGTRAIEVNGRPATVFGLTQPHGRASFSVSFGPSSMAGTSLWCLHHYSISSTRGRNERSTAKQEAECVMKSSSSDPMHSQSDVPDSAVSRLGLFARLDMRSRRACCSDNSFSVRYLDMESDCRRPAARMSGRHSLGARRRTQAAATHSAEQDLNATSLAARKVDDRSRLNATVEARVTPLGLAGLPGGLHRCRSPAPSSTAIISPFAPTSPTESWFPITRGADSKPVTLDSSHEHRTH